MTGSPTARVDARRLYEDLRALLYERFRAAFLRRDWKEKNAGPSAVVEPITHLFLFEHPGTRSEIQKIISRHVGRDARPGSPSHRVYVPEMAGRMALSIGREARERRYDGPVQAELKVRSSQVFLHQLRHPDAPIRASP